MKEQNKNQIGIGNSIIGIRKYEYLKSINPEHLSDEQKEQIRVFEERKNICFNSKKASDYFKELNKGKVQKELQVEARELYDLLVKKFPEVNGKQFQKQEGITIANLSPLIYYFSKDKRFFECDNLSRISEPSFDKGLLIIGGFGNGKTSVMKTFESIFKGIKGFNFKGYSANEVVTEFEKCTGDNADILRKEFENSMWKGIRYFDDLKTERIASNFGKVNIFKEILEERYRLGSLTYVTCNYKEGFPNDLEKALDEFEDKYGSRVYDRLYQMFNIIEFKGKSFRK